MKAFLGSLSFRYTSILILGAGAAALCALYFGFSPGGRPASASPLPQETGHETSFRLDGLGGKARLRPPRSEFDHRRAVKELEIARKSFHESFQSGTLENSRTRWSNTEPAEFWVSQLSADSQERKDLAILVLESAGMHAVGKPVDIAEPEWQYLNKEAVGIGRALRSAAGVSMNSASLRNAASFNSVVADEGTVPAEVTFGQEDPDNLIRDAQPILETFVPRLNSPETSQAAMNVLNLFTLGAFEDRDARWWLDTHAASGQQ